MKILVVDVGGTHVKILATGHRAHREFSSGPAMTPEQMVSAVRKLAKDWKYDVVSIGYPGPVLQGKLVLEPHNLGPGWVGFDFENAFQRPVKVINDAAVKALGSYKGGRSLFLGLGTGLGSAFIVDGFVQPLELGPLPSALRTECGASRALSRHYRLRCRAGQRVRGRSLMTSVTPAGRNSFRQWRSILSHNNPL